MGSFNYLDIIILCFLLYGVIRGALSGLVRQAISLAGLIIAIFFSRFAAIPIESVLASLCEIPENVSRPLSFCIAFLIILLACEILIRLLDKLLSITHLSWINRILGVVFCELKVIVILSVAINIYELSDKDSRLIERKTKNESLLYASIQNAAPYLFSLMSNDIDWNEIKSKFDSNKKKDESVLTKAVLTKIEQNNYGTR